MKAPHIQYATTDDGMSIAYWTLGEGEPYIMCFSANSCDKEWDFPEAQWAYSELAKDRMVVRFDLRGEGLSSDPPETPSLDLLCGDLKAIVDRLGAKRYALHGGTYSTKLVVRHAAMYAGRVSALTLYRPNIAAGSTHGESPALALILPLRESEPELFAELLAVINVGLDDPQFTRRYAGYLATYRRMTIDVMRAADVTPDVQDVSPPVLVLHRYEPRFDINVSRAIASSFPRGRLAVVGGGLPMPWDAPIVQAIRGFLAETSGRPMQESAAPAPSRLPEGIALILFADIVDSTALTERMGDTAFREAARTLDGLLRTIIVESGGTPIDGKLLGDGVLATFPAASQGIAASLACSSAGTDHGLPLHLGLHAGDVIREANNVFGGAVNIASRISALSAAGEVLVSRTVADLARTSAGVTFEDRGEHALKGVGDPVRVYAVRPNV